MQTGKRMIIHLIDHYSSVQRIKSPTIRQQHDYQLKIRKAGLESFLNTLHDISTLFRRDLPAEVTVFTDSIHSLPEPAHHHRLP